jgi:heme/copper-type cytochrome/quinol oxidase subunit 3
MTQQPADPPLKELEASPQPSDTDYEGTQWAAEKLERDKQRKSQRTWLFLYVALLCCVFFAIFASYMLCPAKLAAIGSISPYALWLVSLSGIIPTVLILVLIKAVYRSTKNSAESLGVFGEIAKTAAALIRQSKPN